MFHAIQEHKSKYEITETNELCFSSSFLAHERVPWRYSGPEVLKKGPFKEIEGSLVLC
jgi:hypothetical protein